MIEILIFLITNEVAIRGSWDIDNHKEDGVFRNIFEFEISHNKELRKCAEFMPKNATYLSPDIQNELIWTIAKITRQQIVDDVLSADIPYYTILVDGTKDRTNKEIVSMAVRYVKNGQPVESLLCFETITTFDAETNAELILKTLKKYGLDVLYILSQCYDGANVMRGDHGGIQRIIQDKLAKVIPYVHCFNHRLHLVIIAVIENIEMVRIFFDNIKLIYSFFHRAKIQSLYKGSTILHLVVTRWAGHVRATNVVYENYDEIIETLPQVKSHTSYNFDADDIALSTGILSAMKKPEFVFMLEFMKTFLNTISPADKILQSRDVGFREAVPVIESVMTEIQKLRSLSSFEKMWDKCQPKFDLQARPVREKRSYSSTAISSFESRSIGATEVEVCGAAGAIDGRELVKSDNAAESETAQADEPQPINETPQTNEASLVNSVNLTESDITTENEAIYIDDMQSLPLKQNRAIHVVQSLKPVIDSIIVSDEHVESDQSNDVSDKTKDPSGVPIRNLRKRLCEANSRTAKKRKSKNL
ncbi:Zinc finger MYM-type protein 1 [Pseudolycoriella hygida]|uniref:Zinc finger MYM-type protein 1 n=1 Tax=Pseudolycoriella hygida TaxID=35572 RepID=A0A9Q0NEM0_9DIPT|nr:Zinc finger MYM-type protein 1 [Pseudolycoriella hygida]